MSVSELEKAGRDHLTPTSFVIRDQDKKDDYIVVFFDGCLRGVAVSKDGGAPLV